MTGTCATGAATGLLATAAGATACGAMAAVGGGLTLIEAAGAGASAAAGAVCVA